MRVQLAVATELKRKDLVEAQRHNSVLHCRFEGQGAGEYIAAFLEALPESMSAQAKQAALDSHSEEACAALLSVPPLHCLLPCLVQSTSSARRCSTPRRASR